MMNTAQRTTALCMRWSAMLRFVSSQVVGNKTNNIDDDEPNYESHLEKLSIATVIQIVNRYHKTQTKREYK